VLSANAIAVLREQHGVISRQQALSLGLAEHAVRRNLRIGAWEKIHPGVYRDAVVGPSWAATNVASCLYLGGLTSHRAAARLQGIDGFDGVDPEISVEHGHHAQIEGVAIHQSIQLELAGPVIRDGVRCTGLARMVLDLAAVVGRA
jgi:hypothetical protein